MCILTFLANARLTYLLFSNIFQSDALEGEKVQ